MTTAAFDLGTSKMDIGVEVNNGGGWVVGCVIIGLAWFNERWEKPPSREEHLNRLWDVEGDGSGKAESGSGMRFRLREGPLNQGWRIA
jgi:hypothetical protein